MKKSVQTKSQTGFAHLILLLGVVVLAIGAILYFAVFKKDVGDLTNLYNRTTPAPSVTTAPQSLEEQVNSIPDDDPTEDFNEVDSDISKL